VRDPLDGFNWRIIIPLEWLHSGMPGITVLGEPTPNDVVDDVFDSVRFTDAYQRHDVRTDDSIVAYTKYDEYPVSVFETEASTVVLEGYLYGTADVDAAVSEAATLVREGDTEALSEWVAARDGDFLLLVIDDADGTMWAVNDAFGRLPTYRATIDGTTVVTRELKVVRELGRALGDELEPDPIALGQLLLLGYPLGTRTLYAGVERLPPGSLFEVGAESVTSTHEFEFDVHANGNRSVKANARRLRDQFVEACENRASVSEETLISLSGGLDSRAAIAGYTRVDGTLTAATSMRADGANTAEVNVARQVANALDVPWESYVVDRTDHHREALLDMTQGMNNLSMSLGLNFAEQVSVDHPRATFITGDGGDKAFPDLTPSKNVDSIDELVDAVLDYQQVYSLEDVASLIDADPDTLRASIRDRLVSYPESDHDGKFVHFLVRERGFNYLNTGEDRTRYYMWSTTPFYSLPFFTEAMACPPEQKRRTDLYREFLAALDPNTLDVEYVDYGAPINSLEYRVKHAGYEWLSEHPELKKRVLQMLGRGGGSSGQPPTALVDATSKPDELASPFSSEAVRRITWSQGGYNTHQQYLLLTLVAALSQDAAKPESAVADREWSSPATINQS